MNVTVCYIRSPGKEKKEKEKWRLLIIRRERNADMHIEPTRVESIGPQWMLYALPFCFLLSFLSANFFLFVAVRGCPFFFFFHSVSFNPLNDRRYNQLLARTDGCT